MRERAENAERRVRALEAQQAEHERYRAWMGEQRPFIERNAELQLQHTKDREEIERLKDMNNMLRDGYERATRAYNDLWEQVYG